MINPEVRLSCRLDRVKPVVKEKRRTKAIAHLALLDTQLNSIFEQASQTAARFLDFPLSFIGLMGQDSLLLRSIASSSPSPLIHTFRGLREIPRSEAFCTCAIDAEQVLAIPNVAQSAFFSQSILFQHYKIAAYLAVPLITSSQDCLGTLAVADFEPRHITDKQIEFLTLLADWMMSEIQRLQLETSRREDKIEADLGFWEPDAPLKKSSTQHIKVELLTHLCQDLFTPLTSIKGMTSVLSREIYGTLNHKQKEYLDIINCSGKYMISLVEQILALDISDETSQKLYLSSVDLEMMCQQVVASVEYMAAHRQQKLKLSIPPECRVWLLDKDKIRQMFYYLLFSLLQSAEAGCLFEIVVWEQYHKLKIGIGITEPDNLVWENSSDRQLTAIANGVNYSPDLLSQIEPQPFATKLTSFLSNATADRDSTSTSLVDFLTAGSGFDSISEEGNHSRESLGLLLSCKLAELHGGYISTHQLPGYGSCYLITLPQLIKATM